MIKTIALNVIIFCALMFLVMLTPPTLMTVNRYLNPPSPKAYAATANMPALRDYEWAQQSMWENYQIKIHYRDFVVHRSNDLAGEAINIENGVRRTINAPRDDAEGPVWFFGGSTTFGYGVHDAFTYPSMFAQQTGRYVTNYGAGAWTSRQSLALLQGLYVAGHEGNRTIVFYDGVNDLMHNCNPDTEAVNQTAHEKRFRHAMRHLENPFTFDRLFEQLIEFAPILSARLGLSEPQIYRFQCAENPEMALEAARRLVAVWENAQRLAQSNGDQFLAVFQPASFISKGAHPVLPDHPYNEELLEEYLVVYPLMQAELAKSNVNYVDLSHIFDDCANCYYDQVHVGPVAHQILVDQLEKIVP